VDSVTPAIEHTKEQLFRPFRFGQWTRLALVGLFAGEIVPMKVTKAVLDKKTGGVIGTEEVCCDRDECNRPDTTLELATGLSVDFAPDLGTLHTGRLDGRMRGVYARSSLVAVALRPTVTGSGLSVVLEAMASGRPVVVTANAGIEDYVEHGRTGLLVPAGDCDALAGAIESLLADPDRAAEMGRAAAVTVRERFSSEHMAEVLAGLLTSV